MTHGRAAASLGTASLLQSFLLPSHTPESKAALQAKNAPQKPQNDPQSTEKAEPKEDAQLNKLTQEVADLKKMMQQDPIQKEIASIKTELEQLLKDDHE